MTRGVHLTHLCACLMLWVVGGEEETSTVDLGFDTSYSLHGPEVGLNFKAAVSKAHGKAWRRYGNQVVAHHMARAAETKRKLDREYARKRAAPKKNHKKQLSMKDLARQTAAVRSRISKDAQALGKAATDLESKADRVTDKAAHFLLPGAVSGAVKKAALLKGVEEGPAKTRVGHSGLPAAKSMSRMAKIENLLKVTQKAEKEQHKIVTSSAKETATLKGFEAKTRIKLRKMIGSREKALRKQLKAEDKTIKKMNRMKKKGKKSLLLATKAAQKVAKNTAKSKRLALQNHEMQKAMRAVLPRGSQKKAAKDAKLAKKTAERDRAKLRKLTRKGAKKSVAKVAKMAMLKAEAKQLKAKAVAQLATQKGKKKNARQQIALKARLKKLKDLKKTSQIKVKNARRLEKLSTTELQTAITRKASDKKQLRTLKKLAKKAQAPTPPSVPESAVKPAVKPAVHMSSLRNNANIQAAELKAEKQTNRLLKAEVKSDDAKIKKEKTEIKKDTKLLLKPPISVKVPTPKEAEFKNLRKRVAKLKNDQSVTAKQILKGLRKDVRQQTTEARQKVKGQQIRAKKTYAKALRLMESAKRLASSQTLPATQLAGKHSVKQLIKQFSYGKLQKMAMKAASGLTQNFKAKSKARSLSKKALHGDAKAGSKLKTLKKDMKKGKKGQKRNSKLKALKKKSEQGKQLEKKVSEKIAAARAQIIKAKTPKAKEKAVKHLKKLKTGKAEIKNDEKLLRVEALEKKGQLIEAKASGKVAATKQKLKKLQRSKAEIEKDEGLLRLRAKKLVLSNTKINPKQVKRLKTEKDKTKNEALVMEAALKKAKAQVKLAKAGNKVQKAKVPQLEASVAKLKVKLDALQLKKKKATGAEVKYLEAVKIQGKKTERQVAAKIAAAKAKVASAKTPEAKKKARTQLLIAQDADVLVKKDENKLKEKIAAEKKEIADQKNAKIQAKKDALDATATNAKVAMLKLKTAKKKAEKDAKKAGLMSDKTAQAKAMSAAQTKLKAIRGQTLQAKKKLSSTKIKKTKALVKP